MGKAINMLNMLMLLRSRGKMQIKELSEILEVKERMIRKYKNDFEQLEIYIDSKTGKDGGYYIYADNSLIDLGITQEELSILKDAQNYLEHESFIFLQEYKMILDKVESNLKNKGDNLSKSNLIFESIPNINLEEEKEKYLKLQGAILKSKKVELSYFSLSSGLNTRIIRPYIIYLYQGFWYVIAYCELRDEVRQFKLSRIKEMKVLDDNFNKPQDFSLKDYLNGCIGIVYDEERFNVKLKIHYPMSIKVSERIWVEDQEVTFNEDNSIIFEAEMTGLEDITNWILSMGSSVEVIGPVELKKRVKAEANKIIEKN